MVASCSAQAPQPQVANRAPTPAAAQSLADAQAIAEAQAAADAPLDQMISYYAQAYAVPEPLVRSVIARESGFNPDAQNGPYMGLMQIHPQTARTMGYRGDAEGLLDPSTNLKYAVKYLAGAYLVAGGNAARADALYQSGYYYVAKRKGLLEETGLRP